MAIFDETYRVDLDTPITEEDYPLGKIIRLTDPSTKAPN